MRTITSLVTAALSRPSERTAPTSSTACSESWVREVWRRLGHLYGPRWTASLPTTAAEMAEMLETWACGLAGLSAEDLRRGLAALMEREDPWPPSLPELRGLCRPKAEAACHRPYLALPRPPSSREAGMAAIREMRSRLGGTEP